MKILLFHIATFAILQVNLVYSAVLTCNSTTPPCVVTSITPVTSPYELITIDGQPSNYIDETTTDLSFNAPNILNYVPTNVFNIFPKLNQIILSNVLLTNVVSNAFTNCGNLQSIRILNNNFPTLPANFASTCNNVGLLQLYFNNIKSIDANALKGLTVLTNIYLSNNKITCIPPSLFQNTPVISYIDLSNNQISEIHADTFKNLRNLMTINLVNNSIINLPAFDLTGSSLTSMSLMLQLYDNQYNSISPKFLSNIFTGRTMVSINVMLYTTGPTSNFTCISNTNSYSIYNFNWPTADVSLGPCYANWKDSYQTSLSCV